MKIDLQQARNIVAQNLARMAVPQQQIEATVTMTRDQSIIEAAHYIRSKPEITLDELKFYVYMPELYK